MDISQQATVPRSQDFLAKGLPQKSLSKAERDRLYPKGEDAVKLLCKSKHQIG
jgi:hypothetical protein